MKKDIKSFFLDKRIYKSSEIEFVLNLAISEDMLNGNNKGTQYYNIPCAFDIEVTSFYVDLKSNEVIDYQEKIKRQNINKSYNPEKRATMYIWQFGINGRVIIGRTWAEFINMLNFIADYLNLNENKKLIIYVHNLSYEFQFIRKLFNWNDIFSISKREPITATTENFIEFRCSLKLSNYSLANLANQLQKYRVKKLVGNLDYYKIRNSQTILTDDEINYCINDVRIVMCYIQEKIENEGGIQKIPLTMTGYVRRYCKEATLYTHHHYQNQRYKKFMEMLTIDSLSEFNLIHDCYQGGFTHANAYYVNELLTNVASYDFTSSYPFVMVSEKFPFSKGISINPNDLTRDIFNYFVDPKNNNNEYCCLMEITFFNLIQKEPQDNPLSKSKCIIISPDYVENNGRVVSCSYCTTRITNIDFLIYQQFYTWEKISINIFYVYKLHYLPLELINAILNLYEQKTVLKGVKGKEIEYLRSKEMINSVYGMSVTNPLRNHIFIDNNQEWQEVIPDIIDLEEMLEIENKRKSRFLYYIWGVYVTAYARYNLFTGIKQIADDYVYSDTDSIKILNYEKHKNYFNEYNKSVLEKLQKIANYYKIDIERFSPKTREGKIKTLGLWDFEGVYSYFKTLGAKRYCVAWNDQSININGFNYPFSLTVAGLNKYTAIPYLYDITQGDILKIFKMFCDSFTIPAEYSGKPLVTYVDYEQQGYITDYQGNTASYYEKSSVHMEKTSYSLSLTQSFIDYLLNRKEIII